MIKSSTVSSLPTESDEIHGCSLKCDLLKLFGANTHINFKVLSWLRRAAAVPACGFAPRCFDEKNEKTKTNSSAKRGVHES